MLIASKLHIMEIYSDRLNSSKKWKVACCPATPKDIEVRETVKIYPEIELAVEVIDPSTMEKTRVTGRADWGFGTVVKIAWPTEPFCDAGESSFCRARPTSDLSCHTL